LKDRTADEPQDALCEAKIRVQAQRQNRRVRCAHICM
jgi:hypothetical protein